MIKQLLQTTVFKKPNKTTQNIQKAASCPAHINGPNVKTRQKMAKIRQKLDQKNRGMDLAYLYPLTI